MSSIENTQEGWYVNGNHGEHMGPYATEAIALAVKAQHDLVFPPGH